VEAEWMSGTPTKPAPRRRLKRKQYLVLVEVILNSSVDVEDETGSVRRCQGYLQNFGVTATSLRRALAMVERRIDDGAVHFDADSREIDLSVSDSNFAEACTDPDKTAVWYASPKAYVAF